MRATKRPAPVGRERARKRKGQYFNQPYFSTTQKNSKQKINWSRSPRQRERDAAILASLGLELRQFGNTSFSIFSGKGV